MSIHYTPRWKDKSGNVVIFPAPNTLFDSEHDARNWQFGEFIFFVPFGLSPDGVLEFEAEDGRTQIPHCRGNYGQLGECCIIDGPLGPESSAQSVEARESKEK